MKLDNFFKRNEITDIEKTAIVEAETLFALKHDIDTIGKYIHFFSDIQEDVRTAYDKMRDSVSIIE